MEQLYTHLCKTNNIWDPTSPNGCDDAVECSDIIYSSQGTNSSTIKHDVLPLPSSSQIRPGLLQATTSTISSTIVWIHRDRKLRCLNISDSHLHYVLAAFELQTAYAYSRTMFAGISHLPSSQGNTTRGGHETRRSYAFCIHPKITLVWSFSISTGTFSAVVIAYPDQIGHMKSILEDLAVTREHEMGPLLVCLLLFASEIDFDQQRIKAEVREVELRTGFHRWESPKERVPPATGDVTTLSATMSGHAAKLASVTRKLAVSRHVTDFITLYSANSSNNVAQGSSVAGMLSQTSVRPAATPEIFKEHVTLLERRSKMQQTDTEFIDQRVQIQLRALFNIVAQNDALSSNEVAFDSKLLTRANQRNSSSMRTLAIVTMVFLPGTFVAAVFALPALGGGGDNNLSQSDAQIAIPGFALYWAVSIPTTVLTLCVWIVWESFQHRQRQELDRSAQIQPEENMSEVGALKTRRTAAVRQQREDFSV